MFRSHFRWLLAVFSLFPLSAFASPDEPTVSKRAIHASTGVRCLAGLIYRELERFRVGGDGRRFLRLLEMRSNGAWEMENDLERIAEAFALPGEKYVNAHFAGYLTLRGEPVLIDAWATGTVWANTDPYGNRRDGHFCKFKEVQGYPLLHVRNLKSHEEILKVDRVEKERPWYAKPSYGSSY